MKDQIVEVCRRLDQRRYVANHDGNVSVRLPTGDFLVTPTSFAKADVTRDDLLLVNGKGEVLQGRHKVFSEIFWHFAIYRVRPDVRAIVHGHPPTASGFGLARREIGTPGLPEAIVSLGPKIGNTDFLSPLDPELKKTGGRFDAEFERALKQSDACVVPGNGVWAVGNDVMHAYLRLELVEQVALQHLASLQLGVDPKLSEDLVSALVAKRPVPVLKNPQAELIEFIVRDELDKGII